MESTTTLWYLVGGAIAATYVWRFLGVLFAKQINPEGAMFQWITCVSYAMLAGLITRLVFIPVGPLEAAPLWIRVTGIIIGLAMYFICKRQVLIGVGSGLAAFIALVSYS